MLLTVSVRFFCSRCKKFNHGVFQIVSRAGVNKYCSIAGCVPESEIINDSVGPPEFMKQII